MGTAILATDYEEWEQFTKKNPDYKRFDAMDLFIAGMDVEKLRKHDITTRVDEQEIKETARQILCTMLSNPTPIKSSSNKSYVQIAVESAIELQKRIEEARDERHGDASHR